jgi:hypothetical protein
VVDAVINVSAVDQQAVLRERHLQFRGNGGLATTNVLKWQIGAAVYAPEHISDHSLD